MCSELKAESVTLAIFSICIFLSFYFIFLSFQAVDDVLKKQLVTLAAFSVITGAILLACLTVYLGIKKAFPKVEIQVESNEEKLEYEED